MKLPRHNVPQYMGNAVWDARSVVTLDSAIGAMLGDPFRYARSTPLDLLTRLLMGLEKDALVAEFDPHWPADPRYIGYQWSTDTRERLFRGLRNNFDRAYLTSSAAWARLPAEIRQQLDQTPPSQLPEEAAICAAALLMDLDFESRSGADIWFMESMPDDAMNDAHWVYNQERPFTPNFWTGIFAGMDTTEDYMDPHAVVFTTAYQSTANGWYGGNMTSVFAAKTDEWGSGLDRFWLDRGCAGPLPRGWWQGDWDRQFCDHRDWWFDEQSKGNGDGGELRTPNYKTPAEIDGVMTYPWHARHWAQLDDFHSHGDDLSHLVTPMEWAAYRVPVPLSTDSVPLALLLAPAALHDPVYGVERDNDSPMKFWASPPPPQLGGSQWAAGFEISVADRPFPSHRAIPIWGVLFTCSQSNPIGAVPPASEARDRAHGCAAARALQEHSAAQDASTQALALSTSPPENFVATISALRVWSPESSVDLSASVTAVNSPRPKDQVCSLRIDQIQTALSAAGWNLCGAGD